MSVFLYQPRPVRRLREYNDCNLPGGQSDGGRFGSNDDPRCAGGVVKPRKNTKPSPSQLRRGEGAASAPVTAPKPSKAPMPAPKAPMPASFIAPDLSVAPTHAPSFEPFAGSAPRSEGDSLGHSDRLDALLTQAYKSDKLSWDKAQAAAAQAIANRWAQDPAAHAGIAALHEAYGPAISAHMEAVAPLLGQAYAPATTPEQQASDAAQWLLRKWVGSSSGGPVETAVQLVAEATFGLQGAKTSHMLHYIEGPNPDAGEAYRVAQTHGEALSGFLRAMYDNTQAQLEQAGVAPGESVVVFRGFAVERDRKTAAHNSLASFNLQPMSSFTTSSEMSRDFAGVSKSLIITAEVPRERILSTSLSGYGSLDQTEVVVLGGPLFGLASRADELEEAFPYGTMDDAGEDSFRVEAFNKLRAKAKKLSSAGGATAPRAKAVVSRAMRKTAKKAKAPRKTKARRGKRLIDALGA